MIRGIHHPAITTGNLDRLLPFYKGLLGLEEVFSFGWESGTEMADSAGQITGVVDSTARSVLLKAGNAFLEIFEFTEPPSTRTDNRALSEHGLSHVCFYSDDVIADQERLAAAGVPFVSAPVDFGPMRLCYCRDPDGNLVELQQITDPSSDMVLRSVQG